MPHDERSVRYPRDERGKNGGSKLEDGAEAEAYVAVHTSPARSPRKSKPGNGISEETFMDGSPETLSTAAVPPPRFLTSLFPRSSWAALAFQHTLTEGGMALMTAFILFAISLAGFVTMYFLAPSRTTGIINQLSATLASYAEESQLGLVSKVLPEAVTLLHGGLRVMVIPGLVVSLGGIFVMTNSERRRPGCFLLSYGCAAITLGLALFYLLLRVGFSGQLSGLDEHVSKSLYDVWTAMDGDHARCQWESAFPCSGFNRCCVTNTTLLASDEDWDSLCFATMPGGIARTRNGTEVTAFIQTQCGDLTIPEGVEKSGLPARTTACVATAEAGAGAAAVSSAAKLTTCEDYLTGHLISIVGFALHLVLGMSVCSLVSGFVAIVSSLQRHRTSEFVLVNNPASAVGEAAMTTKAKN